MRLVYSCKHPVGLSFAGLPVLIRRHLARQIVQPVDAGKQQQALAMTGE